MFTLKSIKEYIIEILFPASCLGCGRDETWFCSSCANKIPLNRKIECPECRKNTNGATCQECKKLTNLDGLLVATSYENAHIQSVIQALKYNNIIELAVPLTEILIKALSSFDKRYNIDILNGHSNYIATNVPLHKKRFLERGFNQSELIGSSLSKSFDIEWNQHLLRRNKNTEIQAHLVKAQRIENVKNAFEADIHFNLKEKNVIIVDDVATTLSTLNECAAALKKAGCRNVWGLVVARGVISDNY